MTAATAWQLLLLTVESIGISLDVLKAVTQMLFSLDRQSWTANLYPLDSATHKPRDHSWASGPLRKLISDACEQVTSVLHRFMKVCNTVIQQRLVSLHVIGL